MIPALEDSVHKASLFQTPASPEVHRQQFLSLGLETVNAFDQLCCLPGLTNLVIAIAGSKMEGCSAFVISCTGIRTIFQQLLH